MAGPAVTEPRAVIGRAPIEAPCPALAGLKWDRESSKCKEVIPSYCSSLANPAAPLKRDLRFATTRLVGETCRRAQVESLRGMRSLQHFH
jgi:hypothetical protein